MTGTITRQIHHVFPALEYAYLPFEKSFESTDYITFCADNMAIPAVICVVYACIIFGGQHYLSSREGFDLKGALTYWNLFLATFSIIGAIRTVPHLLYTIYDVGVQGSICTDPTNPKGYSDGAVGLWVMLFIFSKVPELVDTFFIVARKRSLIFLHWYHHITVLLFCWQAYALTTGTGLYFVAMNYCVHGLMYWYYYRMAIGNKPKLPPVYITLAQISQMIVGVTINVLAYRYKSQGLECHVHDDNLLAGSLMYFSYFLLFAKFALDRFVFADKSAKKTK